MDKRVQPRIFFSDEQKKELHQKIKSNLIGIRSNYREILRNLRQKPHEGSSETVLQSIKPLDDFEYIIRANQMTQSAEAFLECISELQVNHSLLDFYSLDNHWHLMEAPLLLNNNEQKCYERHKQWFEGGEKVCVSKDEIETEIVFDDFVRLLDKLSLKWNEKNDRRIIEIHSNSGESRDTSSIDSVEVESSEEEKPVPKECNNILIEMKTDDHENYQSNHRKINGNRNNGKHFYRRNFLPQSGESIQNPNRYYRNSKYNRKMSNQIERTRQNLQIVNKLIQEETMDSRLLRMIEYFEERLCFESLLSFLLKRNIEGKLTPTIMEITSTIPPPTIFDVKNLVPPLLHLRRIIDSLDIQSLLALREEKAYYDSISYLTIPDNSFYGKKFQSQIKVKGSIFQLIDMNTINKLIQKKCVSAHSNPSQNLREMSLMISTANCYRPINPSTINPPMMCMVRNDGFPYRPPNTMPCCTYTGPAEDNYLVNRNEFPLSPIIYPTSVTMIPADSRCRMEQEYAINFNKIKGVSLMTMPSEEMNHKYSSQVIPSQYCPMGTQNDSKFIRIRSSRSIDHQERNHPINVSNRTTSSQNINSHYIHNEPQATPPKEMTTYENEKKR
ncbi:hypothetical protein SNEBB_007118 [Seison nebaliae]|nr:hypothetical protein SNEBB_007118 [Seison nebaliae]